MTPEFTLPELCERAGVSERTVRYYIAQGLLPSPGVGRGARYGQLHLDRLLLIRRYAEAFLPLAEIRSRLERASAQDLSAQAAAAPTSAAEYVRQALGQPPLAAEPSPVQRSTWERHLLAPDVEIHVRRPLSRDMNRRLERLLQLAHDLFQEDP